MKNTQYMMNDKELAQVVGGNQVAETIEVVTNSGIWDTVTDKASEAVSTAFNFLKYVLSR